MKAVRIGRNKSPLTYFKICQRRIEENGDDALILIALEGAIIHAVDTANMLVRAELMEILKIETDYVEVKFSEELHSLSIGKESKSGKAYSPIKDINNSQKRIRLVCPPDLASK
jgi:hypothetical protein